MAYRPRRTQITRDLGVGPHGRIRHEHAPADEVEERLGEMP